MVSCAGCDCAFHVAAFAGSVCPGGGGRGGGGIDPRFPISSDPARGKKIIPMPAPTFTEATTVACLFFIFLVPFPGAGLAPLRAALMPTSCPGHMMMASLCALAVAGLAYFVCGFAWQGFIGSPAHFLAVSGKNWNWIAGEPFFFRKLSFDGSAASLVAFFQVFCVGLAALIPLGSGADRWRLRASCLSSALLGASTHLLFAQSVAGAPRRQLWNWPWIS